MYLPPFRPVVPRELENCLGWDCLTQTEQFGIIFSIVVTSVILILAYMYYLGRITEAHRELVVTIQRRRRRRRRRSRNNQPSPGLAFMQAPVAQRLPSYPSAVFYPPMMYNIGPQPPQPIVPAYHAQQPVPVAYPVPPQQPQPFYQTQANYPQNASQRNPIHTTSESSLSTPELPPRQPSWRQRLARVLGLPVGRASTIASSSAPVTPRRSRSRTRTPPMGETGSNSELRRDTLRASHESHTRATGAEASENQPHRHEAPSEDDGRGSSLHSDVATVHSDDYLPVPANSPRTNQVNTSAPSTGPTATSPQNRALDHNDSVDSDIYSGEDHSLPSVSSMRSEYSPDLRPTSPAIRKTEAGSRSDHTSGGPRTVSTTLPDALFRLQSGLKRLAPYNNSFASHGRPLLASLRAFGRILLGAGRPRSRANLPNNVKRLSRNEREHCRRDWDSRRPAPSEISDGNSGPLPPRPIGQGARSIKSQECGNLNQLGEEGV